VQDPVADPVSSPIDTLGRPRTAPRSDDASPTRDGARRIGSHPHRLLWVAPREGLEPPTGGLEIRCSIQLSYRGDRAEPTERRGVASRARRRARWLPLPSSMRLRSGAPRLRTLSNPLQDAAVHESMGAIVDRTREQLGSSDAMIMRVRRRLLAAATALRQRGETPPGVEESALYRVRPLGAAPTGWGGRVPAAKRSTPEAGPNCIALDQRLACSTSRWA
jgi:hypothetical protein